MREGVRLATWATTLALAVWLGFSAECADPATPPPGETASAEVPCLDIADLAWMTGSWYGEGLGGIVEEHWSEPNGGTMIGMFRLIDRHGKTQVTEYLTIEQEGSGLKLRFRHFGPGHRPWEKEAPLEFDLIELDRARAVFDSPVQGNPRRMIYALDRDGVLSVTIQAEARGVLQPGFTLEMRQDRAP